MPVYRILVVDDEEDVRSILCATLRPHYEILEAHDGLDALEKLGRVQPDFVLMDVMMPLMNGYQACEAIRKHKEYHDLPVMFLSALGTKEDIKKGYSSGANLYLTKPFEPARLLRNIEVFFETTPIRPRPKQYSVDTLKEMERAPVTAASTPLPVIHDMETVHDVGPKSDDLVEEPSPDLRPPVPPRAGQEAGEEPSGEAEAEPISAPRRTGPAPRVMVVDDDEEIIHLMTMVLEEDYEVAFATDGLQAVERLVRFQPDLLIVDIMLPKMSGFQLCQSLRSNKSFGKTPILVCSAKCSDRDMAYARRVGADDFLPKPFKSEELLDKLVLLKQKPDFQVRSKALAIKEIHQEIMPKVSADDAFEMESEVRRAEAVPGAAKDTDKAMKQFLKAEGNKDAFGREEEAAKKDKKKRRFLFGFGKK